jgi:hypothetical protein
VSPLSPRPDASSQSDRVLHMRRILNIQFRTTDKGRSFTLGGLAYVMKYYTWLGIRTVYLELHKQEKLSMTFNQRECDGRGM